MKRKGTIVLLTDFGNKDGYSGTMNGVIHSIHPQASVIDLSHEIRAQNVEEAAFVLWQSYKYFPKGSIFVIVVDPAVGTKRKIICLESVEYLFVAPDNGVLNYVLAELRPKRAVEVVNEQLFLKPVSATFHGRDIFAPVAAHLAKGIDLGELGPPFVIGGEPNPFIEVGLSENTETVGAVIYIDRFGNLITNFRIRGKIRADRTINLRINRTTVKRFKTTFGEMADLSPFCYVDSSGLLGVAIAQGNASKLLRARVGSQAQLKICA